MLAFFDFRSKSANDSRGSFRVFRRAPVVALSRSQNRRVASRESSCTLCDWSTQYDIAQRRPNDTGLIGKTLLVVIKLTASAKLSFYDSDLPSRR
jgi:hypothetical protein